MSITKAQLKLAGWLSITSAVVTIPIARLSMFLHTIGGVGPKVIQAALIFISLGLFVYIYSSLKKLLNSRFQFHDVDICISMLIWGNVALSILNVLFLVSNELERIFGILLISVLIPLGVVFITFAIRILRLSHNLFGLLKPFSYTSIVIGLCYSTIILIPRGILIPIGLISDVLADVVLGIIFFRAAQRFFTGEAV